MNRNKNDTSNSFDAFQSTESTPNDNIDALRDILQEIRSAGAGQQGDAHSHESAPDKEYIMALNSLMNDDNGNNDVDNTCISAPENAKISYNSDEIFSDDAHLKCPEDSNIMRQKEAHKHGEFPFHIGGPSTCLPYAIESFLGWTFCFSCLTVSGYHYAKSVVCRSKWYLKLQTTIHKWVSLIKSLPKSCNHYDFTEEKMWVPLTTYTRDELNRHSPWESYLSLVRVLEKEHPETLVPLLALENDASKLDGLSETASSAIITDEIASNNESYVTLTQQADRELVRVLRRDDICRRLASLAMRPHEVTIDTTEMTTTKTVSRIYPSTINSAAETHTTTYPTLTATKTSRLKTTSTLLKQLPHNHLLQRLSKVWNQLLKLPALNESKSFYRIPITDPPIAQRNCRPNDAYHAYKISLILPAFHENGSHLQVKLNKALDMACSPEEVEVIVVDAGECSDLEVLMKEPKGEKQWGRICILPFLSGGGRGPCLNHGANASTGRILTFCHSDTLLPLRWDDRIVKTLEHGNKDDEDLRRLDITRANSCSFAFGIDTSSEGLSMSFTSSSCNYFPPGLRAVEATANLRSCLYSLPYGDSTLSIHACVFHFLGGYPDQCLMEDYDLVSLLRLRGTLLGGEKLFMMRGRPALCSPRRWQKFGVLHVTYMNSRLVNLYAGSMKIGPNDLFRKYYGKDAPRRETQLSPWEVELNKKLDGEKSTTT